jgi:hypothetical protein
MKWLPQRPADHALERNEAATKETKAEGRTSVFIDESGLSQLPHRAPRGQAPTPVSSLPLEEHVADGGSDAVEFLRRVLRTIHPGPAIGVCIISSDAFPARF